MRKLRLCLQGKKQAKEAKQMPKMQIRAHFAAKVFYLMITYLNFDFFL